MENENFLSTITNELFDEKSYTFQVEFYNTCTDFIRRYERTQDFNSSFYCLEKRGG